MFHFYFALSYFGGMNFTFTWALKSENSEKRLVLQRLEFPGRSGKIYAQLSNYYHRTWQNWYVSQVWSVEILYLSHKAER